jgi:5-methylcytosine-specific restriction protein A
MPIRKPDRAELAAIKRQRLGHQNDVVGRTKPEAGSARAFDPGAIARMFGDGARGPKPDPARAPKRQDRRWQRTQAEQLQREPYCRLCRAKGKQVRAEEVDHIRPLADGGSFSDLSNLQSLCRPCHYEKTERENAARAGRKPRRIVRIKGCDPLTGRRLDPDHWWNKE